MSNINLTCDVCGREVRGYTWNNGMKFCAKCYQETFGNNTIQFVDLLNKEMYELKIADLEAKLAESEHRNEQLVDALNGEVFINYKLPMENAQLKQQLAEKQKELEEQLKKSLESNNDLLKQIMELQSQLIVERLKGENK